MNSSRSIIGLLSVLLLLTSCNQLKPPAAANLPEELTAEEAKQGVLKLDDNSFPGFVMVPLPQDEELQVFNKGEEFALGVWRGSLKLKTFNATTVYPHADHHAFNQATGVFEQNGKGEWVAKVTDTASASAAH